MAQVRIWVHIVWATKHRAATMNDKSNRIDLMKHIKSYAKDKDIYLDFINGVGDHVHCLVSLICDQSIAHVVKLLKGESSFFSNKQKLFGISDFEWAEDYYAASISQSHVEQVRGYIKKQEHHHEKKTFEDECREFMEKYGFTRMLG